MDEANGAESNLEHSNAVIVVVSSFYFLVNAW